MNATKNGWVAAVTLMIMAPLLTEVLPGATRFSALFVLPIEICVWGGGTLLIRYAIRRWQPGWLNMLFLALALAIAEECLIQQTSIAPMVVRLKGITYGRSLGINYVYLLWAIIYEPVFAVFLPIYLVELIFPHRRDGLWVTKAGLFVVVPLFLIGSCLAWFTWIHIARPKVYHVPVYRPPVATIIIAVAIILGLIFITFSPVKKIFSLKSYSLNPPPPWATGITGAIWAILLFGLALLGFGIAPYFPPLVAVCLGLLLGAVPIFLVPRWAAHPRWQDDQQFALIFGVVLGSMLIGYVGFIGSTSADLYFKIAINIVAIILMIALGFKTRNLLKSNL